MIKVGITLGDVAGIGPEVAAKALADSRMWELFVPIVYGQERALKPFVGDDFQFSRIANPSEARAKRVNLIAVEDDSIAVEPGRPSVEAGAMAAKFLQRAAEDLKNKAIDVVVTAPIDKKTAQLGYMGHTEFFAAQFGGEPLMMMCSEVLKVGLVTTHIALQDVAGSLTNELIISKLKLLRNALKQDFGIVEPRIAVLALNPHGGDGGMMGGQEAAIITPAIKESGVLAFGPFPADGFFAAGSYARYDAVLAMYHDQGLAPFKALTPQGVNVTAGLPVVRTSPDHGVAYDIAGQGVADAESMRQAIYMALDIFRSRERWADMTRNPLQHFERERGHKDLSVRDLLPEQDA